MLIEKVFFDHYEIGSKEVLFERSELITAAKKLKIELPKNLGDAVYSVRYRTPMPAKVVATQSHAIICRLTPDAVLSKSRSKQAAGFN